MKQPDNPANRHGDPAPESSKRALQVRRGFLVVLVAALLLAWLVNTPPGLLGKSDALAYAVCHRIGSHSFYFGERPFSLCARCSGQYLGFMWGFVLQSVLGKKKAGFPRRWLAAALGGLILFYLLDGLNSFLHLYPGLEDWSVYHPSNLLRLFSGLGMGLAISGFYYPLMGQTIWRDYSLEESLQGAGERAVWFGGAILLGLLVIWENPLLSYFLILLSTGGLLVLLTLLYSVIWILVFRKDNSFKSLADLGWWVLGGFGTAMLQIALIDGLRYLLTGTWSGFLDY